MKKGILVLAIALATTAAAFAAQNVSSAEQLAALKVVGNGTTITLSPNFASGALQYSAEVASWVDKVAVTAEAADSSVKVSGSGTMNLYIGDNTIPITVTAADGSSTVYTVKITRDSNEPLTDRSDS